MGDRLKQPDKSAQTPYYAWLIWICSALFFFYEFCLQSSPSVMVPQLMQAFDVNAKQLGKLSAYYFYAYALMQLPIGLLLDRFGPRVIMTLACCVCASGSLLFSQTHSLIAAEMARFFMGLGSSCSLVSGLKLISLWFPEKRYALMVGFLIMCGMLGAIGGEVPLSLFVNHYGWRQSMSVLASVGFVLALIFYMLVRNSKNLAVQAEKSRNRDGFFSREALKAALSNKQLWLMAFFAALMYSPTPAFGELWGVPFISSTFSVDTHFAAKIVALLFVGWIVGCPVFGILVNRSGHCLRYIQIGCLASLMIMTLIVFLGQYSMWLMGIGLFLFGFFSSTFVLIFTLAKESLPVEFAGTTSGFLNTWNELIPGLLQAGIGMVLNDSWQGNISHGIDVYSPNNYHNASLTLITVLFLALILLYFIHPKKY